MEFTDTKNDETNEIEPTEEKYSYEDLYSMLYGNNYFDENQILYVYNKVNGNEHEAKYYLKLIRTRQWTQERAKKRKLRPETVRKDEVKELINNDEAVNEIINTNYTENLVIQ